MLVPVWLLLFCLFLVCDLSSSTFSFQLYLYWLLIGAFPQVGVTDTVWPEDPEDVSKAVVDESLQFTGDGIGGLPGF